MNRPDYPFAFRVVGPVSEARRLTGAVAAFSAHAACDPNAEPERECYLSAFRFGKSFRDFLAKHATTKGYSGPCWSPWLWFDIDREGDLDAALVDARKLAAIILARYESLDEDDLLYFFSGSKGFHLGLPLSHNPSPSTEFHLICRRLAEGLASQGGVKLDTSIYDRVKLFRAPNSRHPKTGLHKRRLTHNELLRLSIAGITALASQPEPFDVPVVAKVIEEIGFDWDEAANSLASEQQTRMARTRSAGPASKLQRDTLDFIREGAGEGERASRLFRAAGNLREFNAPPELVHALLSEAALDSGLAPAEVKRVIGCGIEHADRQRSNPTNEGGAP